MTLPRHVVIRLAVTGLNGCGAVANGPVPTVSGVTARLRRSVPPCRSRPCSARSPDRPQSTARVPRCWAIRWCSTVTASRPAEPVIDRSGNALGHIGAPPATALQITLDRGSDGKWPSAR
jgi:hypothetical protein